MKAKKIVKTSLAVALFAAAVLLCIDSASMIANPVPSSATATNGCEKVDFDFTRMNPTVRMTHVYRLASSPTEFSGKTFRISGMFLTRVDKEGRQTVFWLSNERSRRLLLLCARRRSGVHPQGMLCMADKFSAIRKPCHGDRTTQDV